MFGFRRKSYPTFQTWQGDWVIIHLVQQWRQVRHSFVAYSVFLWPFFDQLNPGVKSAVQCFTVILRARCQDSYFPLHRICGCRASAHSRLLHTHTDGVCLCPFAQHTCRAISSAEKCSPVLSGKFVIIIEIRHCANVLRSVLCFPMLI